MSSVSFSTTAIGSVEPGNWNLRTKNKCHVEQIGTSRNGRTIYGITTGSGQLQVSITGGAHADEPVGPRTAVHLAAAISEAKEPWAVELGTKATWYIVPHVNPDGDADNAEWQKHPGDPAEYIKHTVREQPGDDVEFNYPRSDTDEKTRPENLAAANFFRATGKPFHMHASLHSMGVAEGAWFLICREWVERARSFGMMERLANEAGRQGLALHDMERHGEKGFTRISPGFCTTPRSDAMRDYFLNQDDPDTAEKFRPSSMEFIQSLGGDPLCIVSELPFFEIRASRENDAPLDKRPYFSLRQKLPLIREALMGGNSEPLQLAIDEFEITAIDWEIQARLQIAFIREALKTVWHFEKANS